MKNSLFVLTFFGSLLFLGGSIYLIVKKKRRKAFIGFAIAIGFFLISGLTAPSLILSVNQKEVEANQQGIALISGKADPNAQVTIDKKEVTVKKDGTFKISVKVPEAKVKKMKVKAILKNQRAEEEVVVKPSAVLSTN